jgi:hypothetical protein
MNLPIVVSDSTRDLMAVAALAAATEGVIDEAAWFAAPEVESQKRMSSRPPPSSTVVKMGEFLGDPEVDGWLR